MYVILVGCGRVGANLATVLAADGHDVVIIDKDSATFENLGATFNGVTVTGTGIDSEVLKRAGIERADAFAAATSLDNVNLMASQIAKRIFRVPKVIARINDPRKRGAYEEFGVETICPTDLGAVQLRWMMAERTFQVLHSLGAGEVLLVRLPVGEPLAGHPVSDLEIPGKVRVASVEREAIALVPTPEMVFDLGDTVLLTVRRDSLEPVRSATKGGGER